MDVRLSSILTSTLVLVGIAVTVRFLKWVWLRPRKLEKLLREQGVNGNPYRLLIGDMKDFIAAMKTEQPKTVKLSDNITPHILPFYHNIINQYGKLQR